MKNSGIYSILNRENGKIYVGQSKNLRRRFNNHRTDLNCNRHCNIHLQRAWDKYGSDSFDFGVLEYCSVDDLDSNEIWWIDYFDSADFNKGYNLESGGNLNKTLSPETREKISKARMGKYCGKDNPFYGKTHDYETKMSFAIKNSMNSDSPPYFRVSILKSDHCSQGFSYRYRYVGDDGKQKSISSVDIDRLKEKVLAKGLEWIEFDKVS